MFHMEPNSYRNATSNKTASLPEFAPSRTPDYWKVRSLYDLPPATVAEYHASAFGTLSGYRYET